MTNLISGFGRREPEVGKNRAYTYVGVQTHPLPLSQEGWHTYDPIIQSSINMLADPLANRANGRIHNKPYTHIIHTLEARLDRRGILQVFTYSSLLTEDQYTDIQNNPKQYRTTCGEILESTRISLEKWFSVQQIKETFENRTGIQAPNNYSDEKKLRLVFKATTS